MEITLVPVSLSKKPVLRKLLKKYLFEMLGKVAEYKYLDSYWGKPERHPLFIKKDGKIVGFVLINSYTVAETDAKSIAEFYVEKRFRRLGIGRVAAFMTLDMFPGKWEIREINKNNLGHAFWKKIISEYTNNKYIEEIFDNDKWSGPIQMFNNLR